MTTCDITFVATTLVVLMAVMSSVKPQENLTVVLYRVSSTHAEIDWYAVPSRLSSCELVYGPVIQPELVQVLPDVVPDHQLIELFDLDLNTTYHFQMVCYDLQQRKYVSNELIFSTGTVSKLVQSSSSSQRKSSTVSSVTTTGDRRSFSVPNDSDPQRSNRNNNVVLGAACGIVGFLIINVTIVMAVRQYSHWRMRQRRMFALRDEDYNVFPDA